MKQNDSVSMELIMLGTGNASVTRCYNTCYVYRAGEKYFLIDAGGGNGILTQLERADLSLQNLTGMYLTHGHTDHLLGAVWIVRMVAAAMHAGIRTEKLRIYGHEKVLHMLQTICSMCLQAKFNKYLGNEIELKVLEDGECFSELGIQFTVFDIGSVKEKQFGYRALLPDGQTIACTGDEPFHIENEAYVKGADWLLTEAFCLYEDREQFRPYEKQHSTVKDTAELAEQLKVGHLLLYHTEDKTLEQRKTRYTEEAVQFFSGKVYVPEDLERIIL